MSKINLKQIKQVAENATPGPWEVNKDFYAGEHGYIGTSISAHHIYVKYSGDYLYGELEHIALCNPTTVLALIEALEVAIEAHTSISKNSCCYACQQAKFVSLKALARIKELVEL